MDAASKQAHGCNLRKGRFSESGHIYLVTMVCRGRIQVFRSLIKARYAVCCLHDAHVACLASTLAFVIMPDHVHWLFQLTEDSDLSSVVRVYKAKVSRLLGQKIWQRGFHDRALRLHEDVIEIPRYIVANPLRAGLVEHIGAYPHWDAVWLTGI